jgi:hypothetical protein
MLMLAAAKRDTTEGSKRNETDVVSDINVKNI